MKWNPMKWLKKEQHVEDVAGEGIINLEDKVGSNPKLLWLTIAGITILLLILFLILYFVPGIM